MSDSPALASPWQPIVELWSIYGAIIVIQTLTIGFGIVLAEKLAVGQFVDGARAYRRNWFILIPDSRDKAARCARTAGSAEVLGRCLLTLPLPSWQKEARPPKLHGNLQ